MTYIYQFDVLCGKDKTYESHAGNRIYRDMIIAVAPQYATATSKQDKMRMTSDIVTTLLSHHGSRFLKLSSVHGGWEEIKVAAARDKTSHALRFCAAQMIPSSSASSSSSEKRKSKSKARIESATQKAIRKSHRRKVSFDEGKTKCVSPDVTLRSLIVVPNLSQVQHEPISYDYNNIYDDMNRSTWCVSDMTSQQSSIHDLSNNHCLQQQQEEELQPQTIVPFTAPSNADIDTLWNYQLHGDNIDDEFTLVFE